MALETTGSSSCDSAESTIPTHVHNNQVWLGLMTNNHLMQFSSEAVVDLQCTVVCLIFVLIHNML